MPHKDRTARLNCIRQHHRDNRPSPTEINQSAELPPIGAVRTTEDKIQCHVCGRWFGSLPMHISRTHKMTGAEYKEAYGIARETPLWSPATIAKQRAAAFARDLGEVGRQAVAKFGRPNPETLKGVKRRLETRVDQSRSRIDKPKSTQQ